MSQMFLFVGSGRSLMSKASLGQACAINSLGGGLDIHKASEDPSSGPWPCLRRMCSLRLLARAQEVESNSHPDFH